HRLHGLRGLHRLRARLVAVVVSTVTLGVTHARAQDTLPPSPRLVAIGDVHGDYGQFVTLLRQAEVLDGKGRWIGGRTTLVQTGDIPDRGPDSRKVMELLMSLAPQARKAGGRVVPLVGNHEAMNVLGDLRYVHPGEYEAFRGSNSQKLQERAWRLLSDSTRRADPSYREQWFAEHPLGWVEQRLAFEGNGRYATWIRENNAVVKIGDFLFLHGGVSPKYVDSTIAALNAGVRTALSGSSQPPPGNMAEDPEGPLWYRGLATGDEAMLAAHVDSVLRRYGVKHVVIGHSTTPGAIMPRFGGRVILIDAGLAAAYGANQAALLVEGGEVFALHRGKKLPLPLGGDVLAYLEAAAALEPEGSRLRQWVAAQTTAKP
ncbi:MAG TPA: metallophosphoesterase, partial [Gemmatimonadaceae bacterium]|nr:metallophosphoesterase [Gemmatimonadaceae bacterium]